MNGGARSAVETDRRAPCSFEAGPERVADVHGSRQAAACRARLILSEQAQGDASRWSCGVAGAGESGLQVRRSCVCTRAVVLRAGGEQSAADAAGQGAISAGGESFLREDVRRSS